MSIGMHIRGKVQGRWECPYTLCSSPIECETATVYSYCMLEDPEK